MSRVLLIGRRKDHVQSLRKIFDSVKVGCEIVEDFGKAPDRIRMDPPALVITENPAVVEPLKVLHEILKAHAPTTPFLVTLEKPSLEKALEAMRAGAYDCLAKPFQLFDVLAASRRATLKSGRMLFVAKLTPPRKHPFRLIGSVVLAVCLAGFGMKIFSGPPSELLFLGSANLSGIQWEERNLWVGDWFDATIINYVVPRGLFKKRRDLKTKNLFKMQEGQPIALCNTPDSLITIGADLKFRSHQRSVGLPAYQTTLAPGLNPTGLAWDETNLWSSDGQTGFLYRHGPDLRVLETVKSILKNPVALSGEKGAIWVLANHPLRVARMDIKKGGFVWHGPYPLVNLLPEEVAPSGLAIGFDRLWVVSGGDPRMVSAPLSKICRFSEIPGVGPAKTRGS